MQTTTFNTDLAPQIERSIKKGINKTSNINSWAHVYKLIDKDLAGLSSEMKKNVKTNVCLLQLMLSQELFKHAGLLFCKKYTNLTYLNENIQKLKTNRFERNCNWYEGVFPIPLQQITAVNHLIMC